MKKKLPPRVKVKKNKVKHLGHHVLDLRGTLVVALVSFIVLAGTTYYATSYLSSGGLAAVISGVLVDLVNNDRADQNLGTLTVSPVLTAAAQAKANDMAAKGYFAHTSPDGKNSWYWFKQAGYEFTYAGENLAVDFTDSGAVEKAWMNSPTHRTNILNANFTQVGIATATGTYNGRQTIFAVQMFGTPATGATGAIEAVNPTPAATELAVAKSGVLATAAKTSPPVKFASNPVATSAAVAQVQVDPTGIPSQDTQTPFWGFIAASPEALLRDIYVLIGGLILIALLSITGFEFARHHMKHVYAAAILFVLMAALYISADHFIFRPPTLADASFTTER